MKIFLFAFLILLSIRNVESQFIWDNSGTPINKDTGSLSLTKIISDSNNGAIVGWIKYENNDPIIYAQRVDSTGKLLWRKDGIQISNKIYSNDFQMISDGDGGAIFTFCYDDDDIDIYAQRINRNGQTEWSNYGNTVCTEIGDQFNPQIISDGKNGAIITWEDKRSSDSDNDIYAQKLDQDGNKKWGNNGLMICNANYLQRTPVIVSDGFGGAIIAWLDLRDYPAYDAIYAQRINKNGNILWQQNGIQILDWGATVIKIKKNKSNKNEYFIAWNNPDETNKIFLQKIDSNGVKLWENKGIEVCNPSSYNFNYDFNLIINKYGECMVIWESDLDFVPSTEILGQLINNSGERMWGMKGLKIYSLLNEPNNSFFNRASITNDDSGGAYVASALNNDSHSVLKIQHIDRSGNFSWDTNGIEICNTLATGTANFFGITHDSNFRAITAWPDTRLATPSIYSQKIEASQSSINLIKPDDNSTIYTSEVKFNWSNVGADHYVLLVDDDVDFSSPEISDHHPYGVFNNYDSTEYQISGNWLTAGTQYWKVRAYYSDSSFKDSDVWSFTYNPPIEPKPVWYPLYRMYKSEDHDHFYVINDNNRQIAINSGYHDERVEGYLSIKPFDNHDMVNLYRFYDAANKCHFYTTNEAEKDSKIKEGLIYEGITGYAYGSLHEGTEELYFLNKVHNSSDQDNFYTISEFEKDNAVSAFGFTFKGVTAYVSSTGYDEKILLNAAQLIVGMGINAVNGNFSHYSKTSFNIPAKGLPLIFEHTYNSLVVPVNSAYLPLGPGWSHSYNSYIDLAYGDNKVAVVWPDGNIVEYNKNGQIFTPVYKGIYDTLIYVNDKKYEIKTKDQTIFMFEVPADTGNGYPAMLSAIKGKNDNTLTCEYEKGGKRRLLSVTGTAGRKLNFEYYSDTGRQTLLERVTDPIGRTIHFEYNENGVLTKFINAENEVTEYIYDSTSAYDHMLKKIILPKGNVITNTYNEKKLHSQNIAGLGSLTFTMNPNHTTVVNAENKKIDVFTEMNNGYQVINKIQDGLGNAIIRNYNDPENPTLPTSITDRMGNVTKYTYDKNGNVLNIQLPLNIYHSFLYDEKNDLIKYTDPLGNVTNYDYDDKGNLIRIVDPLSNTISITRREDGLINRISNPMNHVTSYSYNVYGNIETIQDPLSHTTCYNYDKASRVTSIINAKGQTITHFYTNIDLLERTVNAENGTITYDYDENGNLVSVTDPKSQATTWTYNDLDLVTSISNPLGNRKQYEYNSDGTLKSETNPKGEQLNFTYDENLRLIGISGPDITSSIQYDANGNIISATSNGKSLIFHYDPLDRVIDYTDFYGNTVSYTYDANSNIKAIEYQSGKTVSYMYDANNRLRNVSVWNGISISYAYRADGQLESISYPNGVQANYYYDEADRLIGISITKSNGDIIAKYNYTLDEIGNITSVDATEPLNYPILQEKNITLSYDAANRLQSAGSDSYVFDANGNLERQSGFQNLQFTFNSENLLTAISGDASATYVYDLFGHRRSATRNGVTRKYALDINGPMSRVLYDVDKNNNVINYYIYGLGLVARIKPDGSTEYYHYNNIGNVVAMTDQNQNVTHKYLYDPFGEVISKEETDDNPFKFVGQYGVMDEGNGLYFMRARYYDPEVGRFISEDPIWDWNLYAYAEINPIINFDPKGDYWLRYDSKLYEVATGVQIGAQIIKDASELAASYLSPWGGLVGVANNIAGAGLSQLYGNKEERNKYLLNTGKSLFSLGVGATLRYFGKINVISVKKRDMYNKILKGANFLNKITDFYNSYLIN